MEKFRPLYDRLYVERIDTEEKTAGGLYIPEGAKEKGQTGKVVSIGAGRLDSNGGVTPLQVKVGDTVFFGKFVGTDIDDTHVMLREDDVLAIVEK